tara:strand:- start:190 stop:390 length:201 start_codon:yes stop_codon:yes gene_type:complete
MNSLDKIKNALLRYSLADVEGDFGNLTRRESSIVGNQETLDLLIVDITKELQKKNEEPDDELEFID